MGEALDLKTINQLCEYSFFVPAYQRGYRWTEQQVLDLLNDINDFRPRPIQNADSKTWYCLQPIVIKHRLNNEYEAIDGQQRLTTIFLILHYLNQFYIEEYRMNLFEIKYQTRETTGSFLRSLGTSSEEISEEYVDFYYIKKAYFVIKQWFSGRGSSFNRNDFESKFKFDTKVICYEIEEEDTISVFTRLNIGKISLTNAELIRALFLNSSNFGHNTTEEERDNLKKKQLKIATEWDSIENSLHNDRFWYFIEDSEVTNNRIEIIFDIISQKTSEHDSFYTFYHFNNEFINKTTNPKIIEHKWEEVMSYYQRLHEWYGDRKLYHIIGYLVCAKKITMRELLRVSANMKKSSFEVYLKNQVKESLKGINIEDLSYSDNNKKIKDVLLLYNILTMLQNETDDSKFPFDIYKKDKWDIEHITARKEDRPKEKERQQWLIDVKPYIDINERKGHLLISHIQAFILNEDNINHGTLFNELFDDIIEHFDENIQDEDVNYISNLALLDSKTNRGYKNVVFPVKRKTIIDRDKSGTFIPICTKNVFLKYFTDYPPKISFWTRDDREKYLQDLKVVLGEFMEV